MPSSTCVQRSVTLDSLTATTSRSFTPPGVGTTGAVTDAETVADAAADFAVMMVEPTVSALTTPAGVTLAIEAVLLDQVTAAPVIV